MHRFLLVLLLLLAGCSGGYSGARPATSAAHRTYCYHTVDNAPPVVIACPSAQATASEPGS
jgi:hypothetical protein